MTAAAAIARAYLKNSLAPPIVQRSEGPVNAPFKRDADRRIEGDIMIIGRYRVAAGPGNDDLPASHTSVLSA